jgi:hypothetical protein
LILRKVCWSATDHALWLIRTRRRHGQTHRQAMSIATSAIAGRSLARLCPANL